MAQEALLEKENYKTSKNLEDRISLHDKYSTNKQGFTNFIISHYELEDGMRVLELGCGTGDMWMGRDELVSKCSRLVLSDFSEGMLETTKKNLADYENIEYEVIDIQDIPFEDDSFDVVMAHMMLYHVPDIAKGISEVRRVLKPGGTFYSATYGENGIMPYVCSLLKEYNIEQRLNTRFTIQNGRAQLEEFFDDVRFSEYEDSLAVTNVDDLVTYMYSLVSMTDIQGLPREDVKRVLESHMVDGVLNIPKEYGVFISR